MRPYTLWRRPRAEGSGDSNQFDLALPKPVLEGLYNTKERSSSALLEHQITVQFLLNLDKRNPLLLCNCLLYYILKKHSDQLPTAILSHSLGQIYLPIPNRRVVCVSHFPLL
jgi:hypothetical protein